MGRFSYHGYHKFDNFQAGKRPPVSSFVYRNRNSLSYRRGTQDFPSKSRTYHEKLEIVRNYLDLLCSGSATWYDLDKFAIKNECNRSELEKWAKLYINDGSWSFLSNKEKFKVILPVALSIIYTGPVGITIASLAYAFLQSGPFVAYNFTIYAAIPLFVILGGFLIAGIISGVMTFLNHRQNVKNKVDNRKIARPCYSEHIAKSKYKLVKHYLNFLLSDGYPRSYAEIAAWAKKRKTTVRELEALSAMYINEGKWAFVTDGLEFSKLFETFTHAIWSAPAGLWIASLLYFFSFRHSFTEFGFAFTMTPLSWLLPALAAAALIGWGLEKMIENYRDDPRVVVPARVTLNLLWYGPTGVMVVGIIKEGSIFGATTALVSISGPWLVLAFFVGGLVLPFLGYMIKSLVKFLYNDLIKPTVGHIEEFTHLDINLPDFDSYQPSPELRFNPKEQLEDWISGKSEMARTESVSARLYLWRCFAGEHSDEDVCKVTDPHYNSGPTL